MTVTMRSLLRHQVHANGMILRWKLAQLVVIILCVFFFFSSRRRHTRSDRDWSSDVCSSDLRHQPADGIAPHGQAARRRSRRGHQARHLVLLQSRVGASGRNAADPGRHRLAAGRDHPRSRTTLARGSAPFIPLPTIPWGKEAGREGFGSGGMTGKRLDAGGEKNVLRAILTRLAIVSLVAPTLIALVPADPALANPGLTVQDQTTAGVTPTSPAQSLAGGGVIISNVTYSGTTISFGQIQCR